MVAGHRDDRNRHHQSGSLPPISMHSSLFKLHHCRIASIGKLRRTKHPRTGLSARTDVIEWRSTMRTFIIKTGISKSPISYEASSYSLECYPVLDWCYTLKRQSPTHHPTCRKKRLFAIPSAFERTQQADPHLPEQARTPISTPTTTPQPPSMAQASRTKQRPSERSNSLIVEV